MAFPKHKYEFVFLRTPLDDDKKSPLVKFDTLDWNCRFVEAFNVLIHPKDLIAVGTKAGNQHLVFVSNAFTFNDDRVL